jgi:hypothetical protein
VRGWLFFGVALTVVCHQQFGAVLECFINFIMHAPLGMAQCAQGVITSRESRLGPTHSPALVFFSRRVCAFFDVIWPQALIHCRMCIFE